MRSERPFKRSERVENEIQQILGEIQTQYVDLSDLGFITITHVKISPDLKNLKVFYSVLKRKKTIENIQIAMNKKAKAFRKYLGMALRMRYTPEIKFYYDDTVAFAQKLDTIFHDLQSED